MKLALAVMAASIMEAAPPTFTIDPVTRYVHVTYAVPKDAPDPVTIRAEIQTPSSPWQPASILPHISATARALFRDDDWRAAAMDGVIVERGAAGLNRTLVWNPFAQSMAGFDGGMRITINGVPQELRVKLNNQDVIVLSDWTKVVQQRAISPDPAPGAAQWWISPSLRVKEKGRELPKLTYPLDLGGAYAIFVAMPPRHGAIELRLTGDDRPQYFEDSRPRAETLWRWTDLTRQHLVIQQPYRTVSEYEDGFRAHLEYVRFVPLTQPQLNELDDRWKPKLKDKIVAGYNEPYSWAFYENVQSPLQHWEPLIAFAEGGIAILDTQLGRGGSRMNHETRVGTQLIGGTYGDPVRGTVPTTDNVGRMTQYTNMLSTQMRIANQLGMRFFANFGATNSYPGTPLEGDFSKQHPEYRKGAHLRYDLQEVRKHMLALFEEALQSGAMGLGLDWCRYPNALESKEPATLFFRELRKLADRYSKPNQRVEILTRFPARGVRGWENMDYQTWIRDGLVDYAAPANLQGRHMSFDLAEYLAAAKGSKAKLLAGVDGLAWGLPFPGMMFDRVLHAYQSGVDGVYLYQADAPILTSPETRRYVALLQSRKSLEQWKARETAAQPRYSKGIYLTTGAHPEAVRKPYHSWERVRVWIEGFTPTTVELHVDGKLINTYSNPPYVLTSESRDADDAVVAGHHTILVRAKDGQRWIERAFEADFLK